MGGFEHPNPPPRYAYAFVQTSPVTNMKPKTHSAALHFVLSAMTCVCSIKIGNNKQKHVVPQTSTRFALWPIICMYPLQLDLILFFFLLNLTDSKKNSVPIEKINDVLIQM